MRTVSGPTDRVVIVGAGLAGLSAALELAGAGRHVTLLERDAEPGGRAGVWRSQGYQIDTGPTVLTMPELIADSFAAVGENLADWVELQPVDPLYRTRFPDGSVIDVLGNPEQMADQLRQVIGPQEAAGYQRFVRDVTAMYRIQMNDFIDRNIDSPLDLLTPNLARLVAAGGFTRLSRWVSRYFNDPRTQRIFSFQSMYAGLSPHDALALYAVISYMDSVAGVSVPKGGMHAIAKAMADAATKHGVQLRLNTEVDRIVTSSDRATGVVTADGEHIAADAVVLTPDLPIAWRDLLGQQPRHVKRLTYSPSCALLLAGSHTSYSQIAHHNLHFGRSWESVFAQIIDRGELMSDPSFFVTNGTYRDPSLAPDGKHTYYVLFPTPNTTSGIDWTTQGPKYRDHMVATLERAGYVGFGDAIETEHFTTPADWQAKGMAAGTPFAARHTFRQTGPFRPSNLTGENIVFAGSGTTPGVGVPMVIISGRLAAARITG